MEHDVAQAAQLLDDAGAHARLVLDHEDTLGAARHRTAFLDQQPIRVGFGARQIELDRGSPTDLAVDVDVALRLADEAIDHAEAEATSLADPLGREEGLEHLLEVSRRNADARVGDLDHRIASRHRFGIHRNVSGIQDDVARLDQQFAAVRHRIARIEAEIDQRGLELGAIDMDDAEIVREHGVDLDLRTQGAPQELAGVGDQGVEVGRLRPQRLLAREGEQLAGQGGRAIDGLAHQLEPFVRDGAQVLVQQYVDVAQDHHQDVVEVVRDAAGELAQHDFHLLRLPQLALASECLAADILGHRQIGRPALEIDQAHGHFHVHHGAVLPAVPDPLQRPAQGEPVLAPSLPQGGNIFRRVMVVDGHRKMLLLRPAILLHRHFIDREETQGLLVRDHHGVGAFVEQHAIAIVGGMRIDDFADQFQRKPRQRRAGKGPSDRHEPGGPRPDREQPVGRLGDGRGHEIRMEVASRR